MFDIGGTLIATPRGDPWRAPVMARLEAAFGQQSWLEPLYRADIRRPPANDPHRQETNRWLAAWLEDHDVHMTDTDVERIRVAFAAPLPADFALAPGAADALRWCKAHGLAVATVSNTTSSADADLRRNCELLGIGRDVDHVVSSCSTGWEKPHRAIFERALELTGADAPQACMIGDDLRADVGGARALGMRAVWISRDEPHPAVVRPAAAIRTLTELPPILAGWV